MARSAMFTLILIGLAGCTSFRTTALYRFDNDSVAPECTNQKLKGIPVKLKVPSHVVVKIYEQQVLLAENTAATNAVKEAAKSAAIALSTANANLKEKESELQAFKDKLATASAELANAKQTFDDPATSPADKMAAQLLITKYTLLEADYRTGVTNATLAIPDLQDDVRQATAANDVARSRAKTPTTALISFTPRQIMVDTELKYTDKVFLVDFRRPAGGILDLKEASMDDEQYFANVQAEVTERTIQDISTAIQTLQDPLTNLAGKPNSAKATSAITPDGEVADGTDFQQSVIALQQFDISEPGWEYALQDFVNSHLAECVVVPQQPAPMAPARGF